MTKWLETIELRSIQNRREELESTFKDLADELGKKTGGPTVQIFQSHTMKNDFSLQLHHSDKPPDGGSSLAIGLVSLLKEFGLVNHTLWVERSGKSFKQNETSIHQRYGK